MNWKIVPYRLWLTITATSVVSWSMILFSIKLNLKPWLEALERESNMNTPQNKQMETDLKVHDLEASFDGDTMKSQLEKIRKKNTVRVAIIGKKAYWVHENIFYETDIVDGYINNENAKAIDAHLLNQRELNRLLKILDSIKEN